jgi:hypothetical protein
LGHGHLLRDLAQHRHLGRGILDGMISRAQSAHHGLDRLAKGHRFIERLPLQQLTGVPEISGGLIEIGSR